MQWLSIADIARITRIPAPTARRYAGLFKEFLSGRKMGRVTKYPSSVVKVFERLVEMYGQGMVTHEIEDALRKELPRTIEIRDSDAPDVQAGIQPLDGAPQSILDLVERLGRCLEIISDQKEIILRQGHDITKLKQAFVLLSRSHKRHRAIPGDMIRALTRDHETQAQALMDKDAELEEATRTLTTKDAELEEATRTLGEKDAVLEAATRELEAKNREIEDKIKIFENELVRLRKDKRELEKYLLDKIQASKKTG